MAQNRNPDIDRTIRDAFQLKGEFPVTDVQDGIVVVYDVKGTDESTANYVQVTDGTDALAINADGSLNVTATPTAQALQCAHVSNNSLANGASATVHTGTASNVTKIVGFTLSVVNADATENCMVYLRHGTTQLCGLAFQELTTYGHGGNQIFFMFPEGHTYNIAATETINVYVGVGNIEQYSASVWYYEVAA